MNLTAPPRPPHPSDPAELHEIEALQALIEEARQRTRRRRRRYAAATAVLAILGVSLGIVLGRSEPSQSASPAPPAPPPAAATPGTAEIVIHYDGRLPGRDGVRVSPGPPVHQLWVYADGRVIWRDEGGPGYRERRLTPEGVELLRSELVSTGLFERDAEIGLSLLIGMQVRNGGRLVTVTGLASWGSPKPPPLETVTGKLPPLATGDLQAGALDRPHELLADPAFGLPASAWQDRAIRAYVPSKYAIYVHQPEAMSLLPPAAQDLLRGKDTAYDQTLLVKPQYWEGPWPQPEVLPELTANEAQALSGILSTAGLHRLRVDGGDIYWDGHHVFPPDPNLPDSYPSDRDNSIAFMPILPHGQPRHMLG